VTWKVAVSEAYAIRAALVSVEGAVSPSFKVATSNEYTEPAVASAGGRSLIVWNDGDAGSYDGYGPLRAVRVSATGEVLDAEPIALPGDQAAIPSAAATGSQYFVTWFEQDGSGHGARVSIDGEVLDPGSIVVPVPPGLDPVPSAASDGSAFAAFWDLNALTSSSIRASRVGPDGGMVDGTGIELAFQPNEQFQPAIGFSGSEYMVAWLDSRPSREGGRPLYVGRLSKDGQILDGGGIKVSSNADAYVPASGPAVAWGGSSYLVTWSQRGERFTPLQSGVRISAGGAILDATPMQFGSAEYGDAAAGAGGWLVVWAETHVLRAEFVSSSGERGGPFVIQDGRYLEPSVAWNGSEFLVAWTDEDYQRAVRAVRVSPSGVVLDSTPIVLESGNRDMPFPDVAGGDGNFLVAWGDFRDSRGAALARIVNGDGTLLGNGPIELTAHIKDLKARVTAAWDGSAFVVAHVLCLWSGDSPQSGYCVSPGGDVLASRVAADGAIQGTAVVSETPWREMAPSAAGGPAGAVAIAYQRYAIEQPYKRVDRIFVRFLTAF
jgi:hypothetical protein